MYGYAYLHCSDVITSVMASQITGVAIACTTVCSRAEQRKIQSSASLAFVWGIHRWQVNSPHKGSVTRKMFPFNDVIMSWSCSKKLSRVASIIVLGLLCIDIVNSWRLRDIERFSALLVLCAGNPFPSQLGSNARFNAFDVSLNESLNKRSVCLWFGTPRRSCDVTLM